jgi:hypothetical protein
MKVSALARAAAPRAEWSAAAKVAQAVVPRLKFLQSAQHVTQQGLLEGNEGNVPTTNHVALPLESQLERCQLLIAQVHCLTPSSLRLTLV